MFLIGRSTTKSISALLDLCTAKQFVRLEKKQNNKPVSCVYFSLSSTAGNPAHQQTASFPAAAVSKVANILSVSPWPRLHYSLQRRWFVNGPGETRTFQPVVASADNTVTNRYAFT